MSHHVHHDLCASVAHAAISAAAVTVYKMLQRTTANDVVTEAAVTGEAANAASLGLLWLTPLTVDTLVMLAQVL